MRRLVIQPGGIVPWHSHDDRPALIYVVAGEITEYASNCACRSCTRPARSPSRDRHVSHWWKNTGKSAGRADLRPTSCTTSRRRTCDRRRAGTRGAHARPVPRAGALVRPPSSSFCSPSRQSHPCRRHAHMRPARSSAHARDRPDRVPDGRRPVRDPGDPAVAGAAPTASRPAAMGFAVNASTFGMAVAGSGSRALQPPDRPPARHLVSLALLAIPTALLAVAPDLDDLHRPARRAGHLHVGGLHADAGLSRRAAAAPRTRPARSPPTSPATSPATCSAG